MKGLKLILMCFAMGLMLLSIKSATAQCAQCAATVESNEKNGGVSANGLNNGIMYLLAAPYIAVGIAGYIWYKKYRRKDVDINMRDERLNLN